MIGCRDPAPPPGGYYERVGSVAIMRCNDSDIQWKLQVSGSSCNKKGGKNLKNVFRDLLHCLNHLAVFLDSIKNWGNVSPEPMLE